MKKASPMQEITQAIEFIRKSASCLIYPPLALLHQTFLDEKALVNEKRSELLRKREDVRNEGYAAATRLMSPSKEQLPTISISYPELIDKQRSN